jgi:hypothetical protein
MVVVAGLPSELVLEIRHLLVSNSESDWSYFGSGLALALVCGMLEVAEVVLSSLGHHRLVGSPFAVRLSFLLKPQA